jgi:hypothetical protein
VNASTSGDDDHEARVDAWLAAHAGVKAADSLVNAFEESFNLVWRRAHETLSEVTLVAIAERVLYTGIERFSFLTLVQVQPNGLQCAELRERCGDTPHPERATGASRAPLAEAFRFVFVEFLTVLGSLTSEILTPALHAELAKVSHPTSGSQRKPVEASKSKPGTDDEGGSS